MPTFQRRQQAIGVQAPQDFAIVWDAGTIRGKAGDYLLLTEDGYLCTDHARNHPEQSASLMGWDSRTATEKDDQRVRAIETALLKAIELGKWYPWP